MYLLHFGKILAFASGIKAVPQLPHSLSTLNALLLPRQPWRVYPKAQYDRWLL